MIKMESIVKTYDCMECGVVCSNIKKDIRLCCKHDGNCKTSEYCGACVDAHLGDD